MKPVTTMFNENSACMVLYLRATCNKTTRGKVKNRNKIKQNKYMIMLDEIYRLDWSKTIDLPYSMPLKAILLLILVNI